MLERITFSLLVLFTLLNTATLSGQRIEKYKERIETYRTENWPPQRSYSRVSLGYALQRVFRQHAEFCGFVQKRNNSRDYVPSDIGKFLGRRTMRTKVEVADISGGGLLFYLFGDGEIQFDFDDINYSPSRLFTLESVKNQFVVNPDENFDSFILTKTCSGYLKAALDAGIEPPYATFQAAFDVDSRRESSVFALSGSFVSPLKMVLDANDSKTIELMMKLWKFYQDNPNFDGHAYFLKEFEGVMIKHISSSNENRRLERSAALNINVPLAGRLKADLGLGNVNTTTFSGTDWETIIFADYDQYYRREELFSPLPTSLEIADYFQNIKPVYQTTKEFPLMTEGFEHTHFLIVDGIPEHMTNNFWIIEDVQPGVYRGTPKLNANYFQNEHDGTWGCQFTITGRPDPSNFTGPLSGRPSRLGLGYTIRSLEPVNGAYIRFFVNEEIQTSAHPIASVPDGSFDLSKKENRRFAFQWKFEIEIEDHYNPVDFAIEPYISNLSVRKSDQDLNVRISEIQMDRQRRRILLTLETLDTYPLDRIDDSNLINYNMAFDIHLQSERSAGISVRPVKGNVLFPSLKPIVVEPIQSRPIPGSIERNKQ